MRPIEAKLSQIGTSTGLIVPATVARLFGWEVGMVVRIRLREGGPTFDRNLIALSGGRNVGVIVPVEQLHAHRLERGDTVPVPFHDWAVLADGGSKAKKPRTPGRKAKRTG